jgi:hypothetical protein
MFSTAAKESGTTNIPVPQMEIDDFNIGKCRINLYGQQCNYQLTYLLEN